MFIPLNLKERQDLGLSVIRLKKGYSVAIMSIVNGFSMDALPSYMHNAYIDNDEDLIQVCSCTTDYKVVKGANLYNCINKCLEQLDC